MMSIMSIMSLLCIASSLLWGGNAGPDANPSSTTVLQPVELLSPLRFDLLAKYLYVESVDLQLQTDWPERVYLQHLKYWNNYFSALPPTNLLHYNCSSSYREKKSPSEWLSDFGSLITSIREVGFLPDKSLVPYNETNYLLLDGGHRTSIALYFNIPMHCKKFNSGGAKLTAHDLSIRGAPSKYLDAMAYQYAKLKNKTYIIIIFSAAQERDGEALQILSSYGTVVYQKDVVLSDPGQTNLIKLLYEGEPWLGNKQSHYQGAYSKKSGRFPLSEGKPALVKVFLYECDSLDLCNKAKKEVRALFNVGNHSIHINDTHQQTLELAQTFFNDNSIHFLNNSKEQDFQGYDALLAEYKRLLAMSTANPEFLCIDGSAILSAYGCRDCRDLDLLHYGGLPNSLQNHPLIESHNDEMRYHVTTKDDIIFNPENHFYYKGVKFASLEVVAKMKAKRNELKDQKDLELIRTNVGLSLH